MVCAALELRKKLDRSRMSSGTSRGGNLASLHVLRGVAIISVLIGHAWPAALSAPKSLTFFFGQFGVILFFFLSGFLMDRTYAEHPQLLPFAIRRLFRILPMYWVSILLIVALEGGWTLRDVIANAFFATGPMHVARMSGVYWTLYIEMLFYATFPLVFLAGRRAFQFSPYVAIGLFGTLWACTVRRCAPLPGLLLSGPSVWSVAKASDQRRCIVDFACYRDGRRERSAIHLTVSGYRVAILWSGAARLRYTSLRGHPSTVSGESDRIFWAYFV